MYLDVAGVAHSLVSYNTISVWNVTATSNTASSKDGNGGGVSFRVLGIRESAVSNNTLAVTHVNATSNTATGEEGCQCGVCCVARTWGPGHVTPCDSQTIPPVPA
jgi:hypothetical protein